MLAIGRLTVQLGLLGACAHALNIVPACNSSIYCSGELLHTVQLARIYDDSKQFVDLKMNRPKKETMDGFKSLMKNTNNSPNKDAVKAFVTDYFTEGNELEPWQPPDFDSNPPVLQRITDSKLREFAKNVISIWNVLGRKVSKDVAKNPDQYSFLYIPNGFIVPGGRFKEIYYWDTYWIVRGLLISNMRDTARGVIENISYLVKKFGYMPNGSREYYLGRSQPPMLTAMVDIYFNATGDIEWLQKQIDIVRTELNYWLHKKTVSVNLNSKNYTLLRYVADKESTGPRPESYFEDYNNSMTFPERSRELFYTEVKSAAESGWDFSSRWFATVDSNDKDNITNVNITKIVPVDLNAIFAGALQTMGDFLYRLNQESEAKSWWDLAQQWRTAIENVLWHEEDGVWYDYDTEEQAPRRHFYPSCATPLWAGAVEDDDKPKYAAQLVRYLFSVEALDYPGGVPNSLRKTNQQWDFPNAWPPSQSILIAGLDNSGYQEAQELAKEIARIWIRANYLGYSRANKMFEKYNCTVPGEEGSGGEYTPQDGFGWTNGVALELLDKYGPELKLDEYRHSQKSLNRLRAKIENSVFLVKR